MNKWVKALDDVLKNQSEKVPSGWLTAEQIVKKHWRGVKRRTACKRLVKLVTAGVASRRMFKISDGKILRNVPHYKLK